MNSLPGNFVQKNQKICCWILFNAMGSMITEYESYIKFE